MPPCTSHGRICFSHHRRWRSHGRAADGESPLLPREPSDHLPPHVLARGAKGPDHHHITGLQGGKAPGSLEPLGMRAAGLVGAHPLAPCPLQGGKLPVGVLVIRGHATVTNCHAPILTMISDARKLWLLQGKKSATKCSISALDTPAWYALHGGSFQASRGVLPPHDVRGNSRPYGPDAPGPPRRGDPAGDRPRRRAA